MNSFRKIIFVCLVFVIIFCVMVNKGADILVSGYSSPTWSTLEGRYYQKLPKHDVVSLLSGTFQSEFEQYVADLVPQRDRVLLGNARIQRWAIEVANSPFGYIAYPTFFGSEYCYAPSLDVIAEKPYSQRSFSKRRLEKAAELYGALILENPDCNWVYYMPDRPGTFMEQPAAHYVSEMADYHYFEQNYLNKLPSQCKVVDGSYSTSAEYFDDHFRTDHHWQVSGAIKGYRSIMNALGREAIEFGEIKETFGGPYWGAAARNGCIVAGKGDVCYDVVFNQVPLDITADGVEVKETWLCESYSNPWPAYEKDDMFSNYYGDWFHRDKGLITISNSQQKEGALLIIGDSYTNCFERFFTLSYNTVYVIDPRFFDSSINDFIVSHGIDDVVISITAAHAFSDDVLSKLL